MTAATVTPGGSVLEHRSRARTSDEYVADILKAQARLKQATGRTRATGDEKRKRLAAILSDKDNYMRRLGQGMIGPIQLKLRYAGIVRNVLMEDALTPGIPVEYDVLDELGQAYILHGNEGEVKVTPFEGKKVPVRLFRIATFPQIKKEDLWYLRVNIVEYAQDESKQAIMKQEDGRLITLIETAITDYGANADNPDGAISVNELSGYFSLDSFNELAAMVEARELRSTRLLMHPSDVRDLYKWDIGETGFQFKDRVIAGEEITEFGTFTISKSVIIPRGTIYLTPDPEFLGVLPIMYSLDVEENNTVAKFHKGWVMDELIGMIILNARGLGKIVKS